MLKPGESIGPYQVIRKLGEGGMAALFLARAQGHSGFERHVAVKVVHTRIAQDPRFRGMFLDEATICARIRHPNVVSVEDLGEDEGVQYLVMEYVHGASLLGVMQRLALSRRRMRPELAVRVCVEIAEGLHAAHSTMGDDGAPLGVVHRDVTPENVLCSYTGQVRIIDFGIAKARDRVSDSTAGGVIKGKFAYMSPEQARGRPIDQRTDIYALGVVLWELLTMRRCFKGRADLVLLAKVRDPTVVPPSQYAPQIPKALDEAVMAALSADPDDRPENAQVFADLLTEAMPESVAMNSKKLADLLTVLFPDELMESRTSLPPDLTADAPHGEELDKEEALHTLTVDNADLSRPSDIGGRLDSQADEADASLPATPAAPEAQEPSVATELIASTPELPAARDEGARRGRTLLIGLAVLALVLGSGFLLGAQLFDAVPPTP